jgi:hypothetical protein
MVQHRMNSSVGMTISIVIVALEVFRPRNMSSRVIAGKSQASSSQSSGLKGTFLVLSILRKYRHLYSKPATPPTNQNQAFIVTGRVSI